MTKNQYKSIFFTILKILLVLLVLYLFYQQLAKHWNDVISYEWHLNFGLLSLSIFVHLLTFVLFAKVWCILIDSFGHRVQLRHAFKISYITTLGRYIPGKIWPVIGMSYLAKKLKINEEVSVTSWIIAQIFTLPSAFLIGFLFVIISPELRNMKIIQDLDIGFYLVIVLLFTVSFTLILIPNKMFAIINYLLRKLKRPEIHFQMKVSTALIIYVGYMICWIFYGIAFWLFVLSITGTASVPAIPTIGCFILAYQIGYLAFFAPGGVGVRELIITSILTPFVGPIAAGISIAARIWNMVVELISALIAWFIKLPSE